MEGDPAQVVQFGIDPVGNDAALLDLVVLRIGIDLPRDAVADLRQQVDLRSQCMEAFVVRRFEGRLQRLDCRERVLQLHQLARRHALGRNTPRDTLQVAHQRHLFPDRVGQFGILREALDHIQPAVDLLGILDRHGDPPLQQAAAHRRQRAVDHVGKAALLARTVRREELQVADRELIDPDVVVLVDARDGGNVARLTVFGEVQVVENGPGGRNARREVVNTEALERRRAELLAEFLAVDLLGENPFVEAVGVEPRPEARREAILKTSLVDNLFRLKIRDQFVDVTVRTLGHVELARRNVEEGHARLLAAEIDRSDEVVLLVGQNVVAHHDARRHQFNHAAFDQSLDQFRVLELFADRHAFARPNQFRQVGVDCMVGKAGQFDVRRGTVGPARERDAQNAARLDCIFPEGLVEIPHPEEQHGIGMHRLDRVILLHQGGFDIFFRVGFLFVILFGSQGKNR